jgi:hypothetical protein
MCERAIRSRVALRKADQVEPLGGDAQTTWRAPMLPPHWYSVNNKTLQAVLTQIRQLTGPNEAALPNEETDCHSLV